jgi:hypothetical protein
MGESGAIAPAPARRDPSRVIVPCAYATEQGSERIRGYCKVVRLVYDMAAMYLLVAYDSFVLF